MDNLVLASVAQELSRDAAGSVLEEVRQESATRFRLRFAHGGDFLALVVSLRAEVPWIGRSSRRWEGPRWSPDPFVVATSRALVGRRVASVEKPPADRSVAISMAEGHALVVELAPHGGNLVLLEPPGRVVGALRHGRSTATRLAGGAAYAPRAVPAALLDPFSESVDRIEAFIHEHARSEASLEILRRRMRGIGTAAGSLILEEAARTGEPIGAVLKRRIDDVVAGSARPVLESPEPPWEAVERGTFLDAGFRLLPWRPAAPRAPVDAIELGTPSATAGLYYECLDAAEHLRARIAALGGIVRAETARAFSAERRARVGARAFEAERDIGRQAEAILAGLRSAERSGDVVRVPDPYDPEGAPISIPAPRGVPLPRVAEDLFRKQRRARRGAASAAAHADRLQARIESLDAVAVRWERARGEADAAAVESAMRELGIAVGLARSPRAARAMATIGKPSLAGIRIFTSADGFTILVGQTGRDNDRLTFKVAAPEDVWLHAIGVPGAHVLIRSAERGAPPPSTTLQEAASAAAWFSDARGSALVDVQWTRRKNVRRARGAAAGTVLVKRFETVRVRPAAPHPLGDKAIDPRDTVP